MGDFHDDWDVNRLNVAFQHVMKGAKLLGTQGNIFYLNREGHPVIDTGSFVQMIARAANVELKIFGKPSKEYFLQAARLLNLEIKDVIVIGDDYDSDICGAINTGIRSILVKTGKGGFYEERGGVQPPTLILDSFSKIVEYL